MFLLACSSYSLAQNTRIADSLSNELKKSIHDSIRIRLLLELGDVYESVDSEKAISYYLLAQTLAEKNGDQDIKYQEMLIISHRLIGNAYYKKNAFDIAMKHLMKSLRLSESINHKPGIVASLNNIGQIHFEYENYELALDYYSRSLEISKEINDSFGVARGYNNIGICYVKLNKSEKAINSYQQAAKAFEKLGLKHYIAAIYNNIGTYYLALIYENETPDSTENYCKKALLFFEKTLPVFKEMGDQNNISTCLYNLSLTHFKLHQLQYYSQPILTDHLKKSIEYGNESLDIAKKNNLFELVYYSAYTLKDIYRTLNQLSVALKYADIVIENNDSLYYQEKDRTIAEIEAQYQTEKKEQQIERQQLEAKRQATFRNALMLSLALTLLFALSIFIGYRNKRKANITIKEQYEILGQANAEILAQRDELEAQRDMLMNQNQRLEEAHTHITDSLHYAQSIQAAILPSEKILESISPSYFIFMKPFQVVSGDFFWAVTIDEYKIFGIADCTGHGVPGAFMSILGLNALNDIIVRHRIVQPDQILNYLRESVINALGQNDPKQLHKDGIDIALCTYNSKTKELQYSGAGIPLWIVVSDNSECKIFSEKYSKNAFYLNNHSLFEVKADIMPVGVSPVVKPFTIKTFQLKNCSASVYLATDGFADQFGGSDGTKFGSARLKNLILQHADKPFAKQKNMISTDFERWVSSNSQVDDVAILGIKL